MLPSVHIATLLFSSPISIPSPTPALPKDPLPLTYIPKTPPSLQVYIRHPQPTASVPRSSSYCNYSFNLYLTHSLSSLALCLYLTLFDLSLLSLTLKFRSAISFLLHQNSNNSVDWYEFVTNAGFSLSIAYLGDRKSVV